MSFLLLGFPFPQDPEVASLQVMEIHLCFDVVGNLERNEAQCLG